MTVEELISYTDKTKPNAIEEEVKKRWISEIEAIVKTEVFGEDPAKCKGVDGYNYYTKLTVPVPYEQLYFFYLAAMIDFTNGEFEKFNDSSAAFEKAMQAYAKWYIRNYR